MDDLKRLIRSILISSPVQMQICKLDKDYEEINGERIPYRTYGFTTLESLLRSIPDIVEVHGTGPNALLKVLVSSKSAHIDKLISKQRLPERRSRNRARPQRRTSANSNRYSNALHRQPSRFTQYPVYPTPNTNQTTNSTSYHTQMPRQQQFQRNEIPPRFNSSQGLLPTPVPYIVNNYTTVPYTINNYPPPLMALPLGNILPAGINCSQYNTPPRVYQMRRDKSIPNITPIPENKSPFEKKSTPENKSPFEKKSTPENKSPFEKKSTPENKSPFEKKSSDLEESHKNEKAVVKTPPPTNDSFKEKSFTTRNWLEAIAKEQCNGAIPKQLSPQPSPINNSFKETSVTTINWSKAMTDEECNGAVPKQKNTLSPQISPGESRYFSDNDGYLSDYTEECPLEDEYINYNVPFAVQDNLKKLISQQREGIWCAEMPNVYLKMFKKPLDYSEYGYRSLIQMCMALDKIFHCYRPENGDFLLFDKTKPIPRDILKDMQVVSAIKEKLHLKTAQVTTEPALIDAEDLIQDSLVANYPSGVMELGEEIPRQFLNENVMENDYVDVVVGEVYDPSKFWVLLKEHTTKLDMLMDEMQTFYTSFDGTNLEIPEHMIKVGLYCTAKYNNEYHRAVIVKRGFEKSKIKVFYADYGTLAPINGKDLLFLHRKFKYLPLQAIRARLASIWPPIAYSPWSLESSSRLLSLVKCKDLVAHLFRINREKQILEIFLVDTTTNEDIYMNDTLVAEGLALFTNQDQQVKPLHPRRIPKYKHMHFFPTFEDLELGNALSAGEVFRLSKHGFGEEYLFPNYYVEVVNEETKLNDDEFMEGYNKLHEKLKGDTSPAPSDHLNESGPNWTEELTKVEEDVNITNEKLSEISLSEEGSPSPKCSFSPSHQVFATPCVKPPPGFEQIKPQFPFNLNTGAAQTLVTTMVSQPVVMAPPVNIMTQQLIDPNLFVQNAKQNDLLQQFQQLALSRNFINQQEQYQNMLFNQQLIAQQQNLLIRQQQARLFPEPQQTLWNNPVFQKPFLNPQLPGSKCLGMEQRQQLQAYVYRQVMNTNTQLLHHLGYMLKSQNSKKEEILFQLICEILLNPLTTESYQKLDIFVTDLLNILGDCQIIDLATKELSSEEIESKHIVPPNIDSNKTMDEVLERLMAQTSSSTQTASSKHSQPLSNVKKDDVEVQTDIELENNEVQGHRKLVLKTVLENKPILVIRFKDQLYVPLNNIFQFTSIKPKIEMVRKLVVMADTTISIMDIRLTDHKQLAIELSKEGIRDSIIQVVSVMSIPNLTKILGSKENLFNSYNDFLKSVNINNNSWLIS